jgi:hypothetical protein
MLLVPPFCRVLSDPGMTMHFCVNMNSHLCLSDRHLQNPFSQEFRLPLKFTHSGTHGNKHALWIFPDPTRHIRSTIDGPAFDKVCRRFELVREDLQRELFQRVQAIVPELREEYDSDSSGLSDDDEGPPMTPSDGEDPYRGFLANVKRRYCDQLVIVFPVIDVYLYLLGEPGLPLRGY